MRERFWSHRYGRLSYSQEGEDLVLARLFEGQSSGVYVDVGAHHPFRFSNTCLLHKRGWHGINIDALPGSMAPFNRVRPGDVNLELGIGTLAGELDFYVFEETALNTFDVKLATERQASGWPLTETKKVQCFPLSQVLERELPRLGTNSFDLLTVDVEGLDIEVLRSNDWTRFRPRALVVEVLDQDLSSVTTSEIGAYCKQLGYKPFAKLHHSIVFLRN